jgi:hypothetical protein
MTDIQGRSRAPTRSLRPKQNFTSREAKQLLHTDHIHLNAQSAVLKVLLDTACIFLGPSCMRRRSAHTRLTPIYLTLERLRRPSLLRGKLKADALRSHAAPLPCLCV